MTTWEQAKQGKYIYYVLSKDGICLKKIEKDNANAVLDTKEISLEVAWRILAPDDYPTSNEQKERSEAVSILTELFRDKVLTEYQYKTILAGLKSGW
jgi:hypothetical protein